MVTVKVTFKNCFVKFLVENNGNIHNGNTILENLFIFGPILFNFFLTGVCSLRCKSLDFLKVPGFF